MAMKLAVVGTHAGGIPEAVIDGETGVLVPPAHARELAVEIVALLKDPSRRARMGAAGHARVTEQFGVGRMLQDTLAAYQRALQEVRVSSSAAS
jgi:glycosyltransferase involved in cell wall biosynthesis